MDPPDNYQTTYMYDCKTKTVIFYSLIKISISKYEAEKLWPSNQLKFQFPNSRLKAKVETIIVRGWVITVWWISWFLVLCRIFSSSMFWHWTNYYAGHQLFISWFDHNLIPKLIHEKVFIYSSPRIISSSLCSPYLFFIICCDVTGRR